MSGQVREYANVLDQLLIQSSAALAPDKRYCLFSPISGGKFRGDVLFYGRAVNGWVFDFGVDDIRDDNRRSKVIAESQGLNAEVVCSRDPKKFADMSCDRDAMHWVEHEHREGKGSRVQANRSALWRVVRGVAGSYSESSKWYSRLVWSNLYKVSPEQGNPSAALKRAQFPVCAQLIQLEVLQYRPRAVVFLTGWNGWFEHFEKQTGWVSDNGVRENPFVAVGRFPFRDIHAGV